MLDVKVIVAAAGKGARFGGDLPKQFGLLAGKHVLYYSIKMFEACSFVSEIIVAVPEGFIETAAGYGFSKVKHVVCGKDSRAESIYEALQKFSSGIILIHDGVRPIIKKELIRNVSHAAFTYGAAIAAGADPRAEAI